MGATAALTAGLINSMSVAFLGEGWMLSSFSFFCVLALFSLFVATPQGQATPKPRLLIRPRA